MTKFQVFEEVANVLNERGFIPFLFGSLGLEQRLNVDLDVDDIDLLLSNFSLSFYWDEIVSIMNNINFKLVDIKERTFKRKNVNVSFGEFIIMPKNMIRIGFNSLYNNPSIDFQFDSIELVNTNKDGIKYRLLSLEQYLEVYRKFADDTYRKERGKTERDLLKISLIEKKLCEK